MSLEDPFWAALAEVAGSQGRSIAAVVVEVDRTRASTITLSAALRLHILDWYRERTTRRDRG